MENTEKENQGFDLEEIKKSIGGSKSSDAITIIREKIVPPSDYEQMKAENKKLKDLVRRQNSILMHGKVSDLSKLIDDFFVYSRTQMKKITLEISLMQHSSEELVKVVMLTDYLLSLYDSLCKQTGISSDGQRERTAKTESELARDLSQIATLAEERHIFSELSADEINELRQPLILFRKLLAEYGFGDDTAKKSETDFLEETEE